MEVHLLFGAAVVGGLLEQLAVDLVPELRVVVAGHHQAVCAVYVPLPLGQWVVSHVTHDAYQHNASHSLCIQYMEIMWDCLMLPK